MIYYIYFIVYVFFHEIGHLLVAKACKVPIYNFRIGSEFLSIRVKKSQFSPVITSAGLLFNNDVLVKKSKKIQITFYLMGFIMNVFVYLLFSFYTSINDYIITILLIETLVINLFPVKYLKNDGYSIYKVLSSKWFVNVCRYFLRSSL
ncbi:MAG: site-2 protease family protein [Mycoplasmatales bacterium]